MKHWISDYVATARNHRRFGRKEAAKLMMLRARALKSYLILVQMYED